MPTSSPVVPGGDGGGRSRLFTREGTAACAGWPAAAGRFGQRFFVEDDGQELVEYGLLTLLIMAVGVAVFAAIQAGMGTAYNTWGAAILNNWQPSPPAVP